MIWLPMVTYHMETLGHHGHVDTTKYGGLG